MMGPVISVPSMGAARILLIPGVIQAPQQRNRRHRGKAGRGGVLLALASSRAHSVRAATAATFCGKRIWWSTECRTERQQRASWTVCTEIQVLSQQYNRSVLTNKDRNNPNIFFLLAVKVEQCSSLHSSQEGCGFDSRLGPSCIESSHSPCCSNDFSHCST